MIPRPFTRSASTFTINARTTRMERYKATSSPTSTSKSLRSPRSYERAPSDQRNGPSRRTPAVSTARSTVLPPSQPLGAPCSRLLNGSERRLARRESTARSGAGTSIGSTFLQSQPCVGTLAEQNRDPSEQRVREAPCAEASLQRTVPSGPSCPCDSEDDGSRRSERGLPRSSHGSCGAAGRRARAVLRDDSLGDLDGDQALITRAACAIPPRPSRARARRAPSSNARDRPRDTRTRLR